MWKRPCRRQKTPCYRRNSQSQNKQNNCGKNKSLCDDRNREKCKEFWKNPSKRKRQSDCGGLNVFSMRDVNLWKKRAQSS